MSGKDNPTTTTMKRLVQEIVHLTRKLIDLNAQLQTLEEEWDQYQLLYIEQTQKARHIERELNRTPYYEYDSAEREVDCSQGTQVMLLDGHKRQLTSNLKLTKAAKLAVEKHLLLQSTLHPAFVAAIEKPLSTELNQLTKEIRQFPVPGGLNPPGTPGNDEGHLATPLLDRLWQQLNRNTPRTPNKKPLTSDNTPLLAGTPRTSRKPPNASFRNYPFPAGDSPGTSAPEQAERTMKKVPKRCRRTELELLRPSPGWLPFDSRRKRTPVPKKNNHAHVMLSHFVVLFECHTFCFTRQKSNQKGSFTELHFHTMYQNTSPYSACPRK